jgi:hypothetical protein
MVLHLRRPRLTDDLRVFWLAASARSDNLIQRLNISSSALGASQKLGGRHKATMLAALALKEKGRLVGSALRWSFGIHISGSSAPDNKRTPLNKAYAIGHAHLCTIGYIVYNCVTKGHGLARIDNFMRAADVSFHVTRRSSVRFRLCSSVSSVVKGFETIPAHNGNWSSATIV